MKRMEMMGAKKRIDRDKEIDNGPGFPVLMFIEEIFGFLAHVLYSEVQARHVRQILDKNVTLKNSWLQVKHTRGGQVGP